MSVDQRITVTDSVAYGVVGADIHVFGHGEPVYLLSPHTAAGEPHGRLAAGPVGNASPPGQPDERVRSLARWCSDASRLEVRWLDGTDVPDAARIVTRFADAASEVDWRVLYAVHAVDEIRELLRRPPPQPATDDPTVGVVVVVVDTDGWPLEHLAWLCRNRVLHRGTPARVVMLAAGTGRWPMVRAMLAEHQAATSCQRLSIAPLSDG